MFRFAQYGTAAVLLTGLACSPVLAAGVSHDAMVVAQNQAANASEAQEAKDLAKESVKVIKQMKSEQKADKLLKQAKGVYIVPDFAKGGLGVGGWGGQGVLLIHKNGKWQGPAFFNMGAVSAGAEVGFSAGSIAMLLMSDDAVNNFKTDNSFSLNATSDFTIINYSAIDQASVGKGDMIIWADTEGVYGGLSGSVSDITWDNEKNDGYYGKHVTEQDVVNGKVHSSNSKALTKALPS